MPELVPVPWQPYLLLTPSTLGYFQRAGEKLGRTLYFYDAEWETLSPTWRPYVQQALAYDNFLHHGGPPASSPDKGPRNHMRGGAGDLRDTTPEARAACIAVGLKPDPIEDWHWNDPNAYPWGSMPIIEAYTPPVPPTDKDDQMGIRYLAIAGKTTVPGNYGIFGIDPQLPQGYRIATTVDEAIAMGSVFGDPESRDNGGPWRYITQEQWDAAKVFYQNIAQGK